MDRVGLPDARAPRVQAVEQQALPYPLGFDELYAVDVRFYLHVRGSVPEDPAARRVLWREQGQPDDRDLRDQYAGRVCDRL